MQTNTTGTPKKKTPKLGAADARALQAQVRSLLGTLPPARGGRYAVKAPKEPQFGEGKLFYKLYYTSCGGFVVARLLLVRDEVLQVWYDRRGFVTVVTLPNDMLGITETSVSAPRRALPAIFGKLRLFAPGSIRILDDDTLAARGIRSDIEGRYEAHRFIHQLFNDNRMETLRKLGLPLQWIGGYHYDRLAGEYYRQTIAMLNARKDYEIITWIDTLDMLKRAGRDISNPKVYLPDDLKKAHDEINAYLQRREERRRRAQQLEDAKALLASLGPMDNSLYEDRVAPFKDLEIKDHRYTMRVLPTIRDHFEDGRRLNHCLFNNHYYEKTGTVILRICKTDLPDKPFADAEVEIRRGEILQVYANYNVPPPPDDDRAIRALLNTNMKRLTAAGRRMKTRPLLSVETFHPAVI